MKHKKQLLYIILLVACMVLLFTMPVFASELTEADVEQAVADQGEEAVTGNNRKEYGLSEHELVLRSS